VPILREDSAAQDMQTIVMAFEAFDARACQCVDPADRKVLSMIERVCGNMSVFNAEVKSILHNRIGK